MNITIIGTGYVGLTSGVCLAHIGHTVTCLDIDEAKIRNLSQGICPIFEEGLPELLASTLSAGRISFTTDVQTALKSAQIVFFAVDTPPGEYGKANLKNLLTAVRSCAVFARDGMLFVNKSTAPVGTIEKIKEVFQTTNPPTKVSFASNPEFLQEGSAVHNFLNPDRIVVGVEDDLGHQLLHECYHSFIDGGTPFLVTTIPSAELIKYAANSFLALKISFINEIADFCEYVGADVDDIAKGIGLDERIGHRFLQAGVGYGGSCFGKDVKALAVAGEERGFDFKIIKALSTVNDLRYLIVLKKLINNLGSLKGKRITVLGLAFKPKTDDVRDATSVRIVHELLDRGAVVTCYDPVANEKFKHSFSRADKLVFGNDSYDASSGADAVVILTEWAEFKNLDLEKIKSVMANGLLVDGRNIYERKTAERAGFHYEGIGR